MSLFVFQPQDQWLEDLQDIECKEKEKQVIFECRYSKANCKLRWTKNKLEIFKGVKYKFENDDGVFKLIINNIKMEDAGRYTCSADERATSAYLVVEGQFRLTIVIQYNCQFYIYPISILVNGQNMNYL